MRKHTVINSIASVLQYLPPEPGDIHQPNKDEISQCENCGEYGFATDYLKTGRFCSQTCVSAFDGRLVMIFNIFVKQGLLTVEC